MDAAPLMPTTGTLRDGVHLLPVRIYYEDTDAGGIVYYANYLKFAERGRTELLRTLGVEQEKLRAEDGVQFVVVKGEVEYRQPARLDDALLVQTSVVHLGGTSVRMRQIITREDKEVARVMAHVVCVDLGGKPKRLPPKFRDKLQPYLAEE